MDDFLKNIDLSLSDFLLFAIILTLFYGLNLMELLSVKNEKQDYHRTVNLKFLNAINFIGIILTVGAGIVAQYYHHEIVDTVLVFVPISFIALWAFFHHQYSNSLDFSVVKSRIKDVIKDEIIDYAIEKKEFTFIELEKDYYSVVTIDKLIRKISLIENRPVRFLVNNLEDVFTPFNFNRGDIQDILYQLSYVDHVLEFNEGKYLLIKVPTEANKLRTT